MIHHIVLTKFKPETSVETVRGIYGGLESLVGRIPGALGFSGGPSNSPEDLERGYTHGFVIDFENWDALLFYAEHEEHKALGAQLVENSLGGIDGLLVVDIEVPV